MSHSQDSADFPKEAASLANNKPPNNLQQLLCLSTSLQTDSNPSATNQIEGQDEEEEDLLQKQKFLQSALSAMTSDIGTQLQQLINTICEIEKDSELDVNKYCDVLEDIVDLVGHIDYAKVFYQKGGLEAILPVLKHKDSSLRWRSTSVITECCQNNPFCQNLSTSTKVFLPLVEQFTKDPDIIVKQKAVSAISAIIRDNPKGLELLKSMNVLDDILGQGLSSQDERLFNKTVWLVSALAHTSTSIRDDLVRFGVIEKLIRPLHSNKTITAEHVIHALISLTKNHIEASKECLREDLELMKYLRIMVLSKKNDESFKDFIQCAEELSQILTYGVLPGRRS